MTGNNILQQIGESFEDIGKDIVRETVKVPKDILGKVIETGSNKQKKQQTNQTPKQKENEEIKKVVARKALEEIAGIKLKQKEPTIWEKIQEEEKQKNEEKKKKAQTANQALQPAKAKRARGDLYGMKAKKTSAENKNVRQD